MKNTNFYHPASQLLICSLQNHITDKNIIGNKGANLVQMHKLGINVPQSLFITARACRMIHGTGQIPVSVMESIEFAFGMADKIAIRSSGVVSMAGMMDTVLDVPKTDEEAIKTAILSVVQSWDSERAKSYRKVCKIDESPQIAIVVQPMVRGNKGCSGICFSRNPNNGENEVTGEFLERSLGDGLANGKVTPLEFVLLDTDITMELCTVAAKLEKHFKHVQDIEFVNDGEQTYIVQTRNAQLSPLAKIKTLIDFYHEGVIDLNEFKARYNPKIHEQVKSFKVLGTAEPLFTGTPAVNGVFTGIATFNKQTATKENVLIVDETTPDDMQYLNNMGALITKIGGITSHPAVVCRQMGKPCIVGCFGLNIDERLKRATHAYLIQEIHEGDTITIIGDTGEVYYGRIEVEQEQMFTKEINEIISLK